MSGNFAGAQGDAVALAWEHAGDSGADTVVLGHSLGADRSMWEPQLEPLASYRLIRVDLRGHGASPVPRGPYSVEQLANDVLRVADTAGVRRFHYCGVSLGGLVGLFLAARHPERVCTLVAANTAAKIGTSERWAERCHAVRESGMGGIRDAIVPRWFAPDFAAREPLRFARLNRVFAATDAEGYVACCEALASADLTREVALIRVPTLVVGGDLDVSTPVAEARALHAGIPGSRLAVLEGAGHLSNLDRSAAFNAAVTAFLDEHRASGEKAAG